MPYPEIVIGSTVFFIYGDRIEEACVSGETPRKWVAKQGDIYWEWSFPKRGGDVREGRSGRGNDVRTRRVFMTREAADAYVVAERKASHERMWLHEHRWHVARRVQYDASYEQVRQIATLLGYDAGGEGA